MKVGVRLLSIFDLEIGDVIIEYRDSGDVIPFRIDNITESVDGDVLVWSMDSVFASHIGGGRVYVLDRRSL